MKMKNAVFILSLVMIISAFGKVNLAQTMNEDFRKTAPEPLKAVPFNVSKPFKLTLPNGLQIVIFEDKRLPLVSYRLAFKTGDTSDPKDLTGLTSAMASMLSEGTQTRSSKQLAEEIERLGAAISASSGSDSTVVAASTLSLYKSEVLGLLAEMALKPMFPKGELDLYKNNLIQNLKVLRSDAGFLAGEQVARVLYGSNPYGVVSPSPADVEKLTAEKLKGFHDTMFVPGNATLIVVGDVDRDSLVAEIRKNFGDWKAGEVKPVAFTATPKRDATTITLVDRPGSAQSNIVLANIAINRNSPDYFPVLVMNQVLGAGPSARLFLNLREEKGYTYGAYSSIDARRGGGSFEATAEVRTQVTGDSLKEFFYELRRIRDEKVSEKELRDAKNFLTGVFPIRAETQEGLTNLITNQQLFDLPEDYLQTYRQKVNAVTIEDVEKMARKYVRPEEIAIVIVGDVGAILPQVKSYSKMVEIFDADGKPLTAASFETKGGSAGEPVNADGTWNLEIDAQGQKLPATLFLVQDGDSVKGTVKTQFGEGALENASITGDKFTGSAKMSAAGRDLDLHISGTISGDTMKGTIDTGIPGFPPLMFVGTRAKL